MRCDYCFYCDEMDKREQAFRGMMSEDTVKNLATGEVSSTGLPASNVLYYDLSDGAWLCVRPSGTEPKVKFYYGVKGRSLEDADEKSEKFGEAVLSMIQNMM